MASLLLSGCFPSVEGLVDEQKDPHYLSGRARVSSLDYRGAIEEFEKALETNPRSAAAHLELALLHEEQMKDYAAAIFHYERHLKYRPNSEYLERAKDRIKACKMELVRSEVIGPVTQGMQRDLERLMSENMLLRQRVETLEAQLAGRPQPVSASQAPMASVNSHQEASDGRSVASVGAVNPPIKAVPAPSAKLRSHVVKQGDKLTTIAREYGVDLSRLMKANPGVDPTRLKIGQTINIP